MSKKKQRNRANKRAKKQHKHFDWPWARKRGAIIPEYFPSCPDCETNQYMDGPDPGTGIFYCGQCNSTIVMIVEDGEDLSVHIEELEQFTGKAITIEDWSGSKMVGSTVYRPCQLVETTDE